MDALAAPFSVTIGVATFGADMWPELARTRAIPSAEAQGVPVIHHHGASLHEARNAVLAATETEFLVNLDADDELAAGYIAAMGQGVADLRAPAVQYMRGRLAQRPHMPRVAGHIHACEAACLAYGNWLVIGTAVRADALRKVGGWRDFPWSEDWDGWTRCWQSGATVEAIPAAIYRAHVRHNSRNRGQLQAARLAAHRAIAEANGLPIP